MENPPCDYTLYETKWAITFVRKYNFIHGFDNF